MYTMSTQVDNVRRYISSLHLSKKECIILRIILYICLIEFLVVLFFIKIWFFSNDTLVYSSTAYASNVESNIKLGKQFELFISELNNNGFNTVISQKITRKPLVANGVIVALQKDNIEVFEYPDRNNAMAESALLAKKYRKPAPNPWSQIIHIYVKDNLVIFYMGKREDILSVLAPIGQLSLIKPKPAEVLNLSVSR